MNILALDTATTLISVAVSSADGIRQFEADAGPKHSEILMEVIDYLLKASGLAPGDLDIAACMRGPGSFTGIRIGFAAAKGIALARGIPLIAAPTLDCIAARAVWPGIVVPAIDAKRNRFFAAVYRRNKRQTDFMDADAGEIARAISACSAGEAAPPPVLLTGPDSALLAPLLAGLPGECRIVRDPASRRGSARELLEFSRNEYILKKDGGLLFEEPVPVYLRKSDAEIKFNGNLSPNPLMGAPET